MNLQRVFLPAISLSLFLIAGCFAPAHAVPLSLPNGTSAIVDKIYSFRLDEAIEDARHMQQDQPQHPLGYLLEAEALWWKIWCTSADFKYGMSDARRRPKLESDKHYFELATKVTALAEQQQKEHETAEMAFYAGMGEALAARLYGLRWENRNTARAGVRAQPTLRAISQNDPV